MEDEASQDVLDAFDYCRKEINGTNKLFNTVDGRRVMTASPKKVDSSIRVVDLRFASASEWNRIEFHRTTTDVFLIPSKKESVICPVQAIL